MADLSNLPPLRRARAELIREELIGPEFELTTKNYGLCTKALGLTKEQLDLAIEDCVEAGLATLRSRKGVVCVLACEVQPGFQVIRRYPRPVLPSLEQTHRSAVQNHVHRATQMGPWVPINAGWYKRTSEY